MKERALYIGRFQPSHLGHISVLEQMDQAHDFEEILIGIGSSQFHHVLNNPFTFEERADMIQKNLDHLHKPYQIIAIPDINNYPQWVKHVQGLVPGFKIAYTGNPLVQKLFMDQEYRVRSPQHIYNISGTEVRQRMLRGENWQELLPEGSISVINKIKGVDRILETYKRYLFPAVTTDAIIDYCGKGIILIQRKEGKIEGGKWALPGGFLDTGRESAKACIVREVREETSLIIDPLRTELVGEYSDPQRDPRYHTVSLVYFTRVDEGEPRAGDDAQAIRVCPWDKIPTDLAFDHWIIINDFLRRRNLNGTNPS